MMEHAKTTAQISEKKPVNPTQPINSQIAPLPDPQAPLHTLECRIADIDCYVEFKDHDTPVYYGMFNPHVVTPAVTEKTPAIYARYNERNVVAIIQNRPPADAAFAEWQLAYDQVARQMLRFGRLTFHGACIEYAGKACTCSQRSAAPANPRTSNCGGGTSGRPCCQ